MVLNERRKDNVIYLRCTKYLLIVTFIKLYIKIIFAGYVKSVKKIMHILRRELVAYSNFDFCTHKCILYNIHTCHT